jgi:TonB family protein
MGRLVIVAVTAVGCLAQPTAADAKFLEPIAQWVVDYRTDQCLATQEYGTPGKTVTFGIRPAPNGETYLLFLAQKRFGPEEAAEQGAAIDFGNGPIKSWFLEYQQKPSDPDVYQFRISAAEMEQAKSAATVKLSPNKAPDLELQLRSIPALMKTLENCTADLKNYWNMGGEKDGRVTTPAKGEVRTLFSSGDYPAEAYSRSQGGTSQFMLLVDETGKVAGCDVIVASGIPVLDAMGCQVIRRRAKFRPALGKDGKPVRSSYVTPPVTWRMN